MTSPFTSAIVGATEYVTVMGWLGYKVTNPF
jgi:hypothetical protein